MATSNSLTLFDLFGTSNLDEPKPSWNDPSVVLGLTITFICISSICHLLRLYVRLMVIKTPGWDDLCVGLFMVSDLAGAVGLCLNARWGLGEHFIFLTVPQMQLYLKTFYFANFTFNISTSLIKISLFFQFLRIFEKGTWVRLVCQLSLILTALWGFSYSFIAIFPCFPVEALWSVDIAARTSCYGYGSLTPDVFYATFASHSAFNMILDALVLGLGVMLYINYGSRTRNTRLGLLAMLFIGLVGNVLSILRLGTVIQHRAATVPVFDPSWYGPISIVLAMVEVNIASICASVPVFWPVMVKNFGNIFVTEEIHIVRESRDDEVGLRQRGHKSRLDGSHSVDTSGASESDLESWVTPLPAMMEAQLKDEYLMGQVSPFANGGAGLGTEVSTGYAKKSKGLFN